jgi:hypothetical protein
MLLLGLLTACGHASEPARVVAIGDLHGDPSALERVLALAGLVDAGGAWTGGAARLVFTGDMVDRGPDSRGVLRRIRQLQAEGHATPLLGNHEVMNLQGDLRYVNPEDSAGYGGADARAAAFGPTGEDGAWLRGLDAVAKVEDTVFVHGGVDANWAQRGIPELNRLIHEAIDAPVKAPVLGSDGPLWNRAYLLADPAQACPELDKALAALGAKRMVVGHTRQEDGRIASRCEGRLYGIDTGLSVAYGGGHDAALELVAGVARELYPAPTAAR